MVDNFRKYDFMLLNLGKTQRQNPPPIFKRHCQTYSLRGPNGGLNYVSMILSISGNKFYLHLSVYYKLKKITRTKCDRRISIL